MRLKEKKTYRPYVSLDIETTGIGPLVDTLQIAAVFDNGKSLEELETFDVILDHKAFTSAEVFALWMNQKLITTMKEGKDPRIVAPSLGIKMLCEKLEQWGEEVKKYDEKHEIRMRGRHIIAGKNAASFDKPKLLYAAETYGNEKLKKRLENTWSYKTLDLGSTFYPYYGYNPSLSEINKDFTGRADVSHDALDDAWDVVHGTRKAMSLVKG